MTRRNLIGLLLIVAVAGLLIWAFEAAGEQARLDPKLVEQYDRFIEVVQLVQKQYVHDVDTKKMFENAINGMLGGLDPFSNYIPEEELAEFKKATLGKFSGIGIQIGMRRGMLTVISPLEESPAYKAGVLAGDVITEIEGKTTENIRLEEAVKMIQGEPGTKVRLKVHHMTGENEEFTITRDKIEVQTIKGYKRDANNQWVYWVDADKKIAYVRLTSFTESSGADLRKVLDGLLKDGMKGLILDLRFDPGGILKTAVEVCDMFIDQGIIVQTKGRTTSYWEATATKPGTLPFFPMVALINPFSASASEIVSGCLQDHHRAIIVGERSFGKGSVQNVIPLEGGKAELKLTTSKYYLPSGRNIHREEEMTDKDEWGVVPDIVVPMTPEEYVGIVRARQESEVIHKNGAGAPTKPEGPPKSDAPKPEAPKSEAPKDEKPKSEAPKDEKPKSEAPKPDRPKSEGPVMPSPDEEDLPGAAPAATPAAAAKAPKAFEDKQLLRSLDVLKSMEILEKYLKKEPVKAESPKPAETKKAA